MYIKVDKTPNENVLLFTTGQNFPFQGEFLLQQGSSDNTSTNPVGVQNILNTPGVQSVLACDNFVSVSKDEETPWGEIKPKILLSIVQILDSTINTAQPQENQTQQYQPTNQLEEEILLTINQRVRPSIKSHGGDIEFMGVENNIAKVRLRGACVGCASSSVTLKEGIEKMIVRFFPTIEGVREV